MHTQKASYWDQLWDSRQTGWDIGYASPPIVEYFEQIQDKSLKILIPGAGNAWEAEYLWMNGFREVFVLDFSSKAISRFRERMVDFPDSHIIQQDFFLHKAQYDIIVEQTFFSSLQINQRQEYAKKMKDLLKNGGKLVGLLFNHHFNFIGPPFGGTPKEYQELFQPYFQINKLETAYNSIKPRNRREHFISLENI